MAREMSVFVETCVMHASTTNKCNDWMEIGSNLYLTHKEDPKPSTTALGQSLRERKRERFQNWIFQQ